MERFVVADRASRCAEIVRAAYLQVAAVGFEGLRMRPVAAEVGVDQSTLHHYFPTKQDIVAGIADYAISQFASTPPATNLREHLDHLRKIATEDPAAFTVCAELRLRAGRDPAVREVLARYYAVWRSWLSELLGDAGTPATVELVIAVVNGVQLNPDSAGPAFDRLITLLEN
ncbi:MAG TPA: TetR/AcrR family transcriptional regulator [Pseudonocardiaceae bacterium]|nr:TetR/AcrR family transcriptional regulator [Pseudonocardiaceae bacterium]